MRSTVIVTLMLVGAVCENGAAAVWCVDKDNTAGPWNGTSWATAFNTIQAGVNTASNAGGGEVWVAEGPYTGAGTNVVFMASGVGLYGGFAGTETLRAQFAQFKRAATRARSSAARST